MLCNTEHILHLLVMVGGVLNNEIIIDYFLKTLTVMRTCKLQFFRAHAFTQ